LHNPISFTGLLAKPTKADTIRAESTQAQKRLLNRIGRRTEFFAAFNQANANTSAIINNANANTTTIVNLILRTQIEQSLTVSDNGAEVALFELPNAHGGYLDLVATIVTQTLANIQAAGGSIGPAQSFLTAANTAKAAGNFKLAYF